MAEIEFPTESIEEQIHHEAHKAHEAQHQKVSSHEHPNWISHVALSSAFFAVFAAVAALMSNHHANEAMIDRVQASDQWSFYQAKGIKANLLSTKLELLTSLGKSTSKDEQQKVSTYKKEQEEILATAREKEEASEHHLSNHLVLARSVTLFQVAIAIAAISVLTRRRIYWFVGLGFASIGLGFLVQGAFLLH